MNLRKTIILNIIDSHKEMGKGYELKVHVSGFKIVN